MHQTIQGIKIPTTIHQYNIIEVIGSGGFAVIVQAFDTKKKRNVAIKIISRDHAKQNDFFWYLERELRLCTRFKHPNIAQVYEILYEPDYIMIVMEYIPGGDLHQIANNTFKFSSRIKLQIAEGILKALSYLHSRGICHRDIKLDNILLDENLNPKLIDFGLSRENCDCLQTICGTANYMAPEMLNQSNTYDGKKADIWSFGILFFAMMNGKYPWNEDCSISKLYKGMLEGSIKINIPQVGVIGNILKNSLALDPEERYTSEQLLELFNCIREKRELLPTRTELRKEKRDSLPHLCIRPAKVEIAEHQLTARIAMNGGFITLRRRSV